MDNFDKSVEELLDESIVRRALGGVTNFGKQLTRPFTDTEQAATFKGAGYRAADTTKRWLVSIFSDLSIKYPDIFTGEPKQVADDVSIFLNERGYLNFDENKHFTRAGKRINDLRKELNYFTNNPNAAQDHQKLTAALDAKKAEIVKLKQHYNDMEDQDKKAYADLVQRFGKLQDSMEELKNQQPQQPQQQQAPEPPQAQSKPKPARKAPEAPSPPKLSKEQEKEDFDKRTQDILKRSREARKSSEKMRKRSANRTNKKKFVDDELKGLFNK